MIAAQAMKALAVLLEPQPPGFDARNYVTGSNGGVAQAYSRSSQEHEVDARPVADTLRSSARAFLDPRRDLVTDEAATRRLMTFILLRMLTLHDGATALLIRSDDTVLTAFCAQSGLPLLTIDPAVPVDGSPGSGGPSPTGTLISIDCDLAHVSAALASRGAWSKGIVVAPMPAMPAIRAFRQRLPSAFEEIRTAVNLGSGRVTAWLWPRL